MAETSTTPRTLRVEFDPVDNEPAAVYDVIITAPDGTIVAMRSFTEADVQNGRVRADIGGLDPDLTYTIDLRVTTPEGTFPLDTMMRSPPGMIILLILFVNRICKSLQRFMVLLGVIAGYA